METACKEYAIIHEDGEDDEATYDAVLFDDSTQETHVKVAREVSRDAAYAIVHAHALTHGFARYTINQTDYIEGRVEPRRPVTPR